MVNYSITDLEKITGIKAHTIRIWEKRYNVVCPERTTTNIRCYSDEDLKRLLNISMLNRYGFRISSIVKMTPDELCQKVLDISEVAADNNIQIEHLIVAMMELNEEKFEKILTSSLIKHGFEETVTKIIYPFLERIGILWLVGTIKPAHEHFIVNLIRQKIITAIDGLMVNFSADAKKFILFLPPDEMHEISLLFYWYILKKMGHRVVYFGQSLPVDNLKAIIETHRPEYLLSVITAALMPEQYQELVWSISEAAADKQVFLTGLQTREHSVVLPQNISVIATADDLRALPGLQ